MNKEHKNKILELLKENEEILNSNDFSALYNRIPDYLTPDTTSLLLTAGINILAHDDFVPTYYLYNIKSPQEEIIIPENIDAIGEKAFSQCRGLKKITIYSTGYIGSRAFYDCPDLEEVDIREGTTNIFSESFESCPHLTKVTLPASLMSIGVKAFDNCNKLYGTSINYRGTMEQWKEIEVYNPNGLLYTLDIVCNDGTLHYNNDWVRKI